MIRIGIGGICGRMGTAIQAAAESVPEVVIAGGVARSADPRGGQDLFITDDPGSLAGSIDAFIDVSSPDAMLRHIEAMTVASVPYVSGVTGIGPAHQTALDRAAASIPTLYAANFSLGVAVVAELVRMATRSLPDADVEIVEMHHRRKQDAPSGTALHFIEVIEAEHSASPDKRVYGRQGHSSRQPGEIGVHSLRGGGNSGEHRVVFAMEGEEVIVEHRALSRATFAEGALRAACWLVQQPPGRYAMRDVVSAGRLDR